MGKRVGFRVRPKIPGMIMPTHIAEDPQNKKSVMHDASAIYLTFDDGPDPDTTPPLLDLLAAHGVRATFFILGRQAVRYPHLVKRIHDAGHAIGNHTWAHLHPLRMTCQTALEEVYKTTVLLEGQTGQPVSLFRPPYGYVRPCMRDQARELGQRVLLWDRSAVDWGWFAHERFIARRLNAVKPGEIVLLHDAVNKHNHPDATLNVLPGFLKRKLNEGYRFEAVA